ncbi:GTP-binding protein [Streptomyces sp. NBC_01296]|uniref:GTP-binding protein n=1 Tax=Streptomyces sp. NBC_01296 TaxID=2903816 RepID=UPI002E11BC0A|nr:GTP-binding protein [Streptomyces sp. NBC_01296]
MQADGHGQAEAWAAWMEPAISAYAHPHPDRAVSTFVWRSRRPVHPERLTEALGDTTLGVLRSRGHLWLANRPESAATWRSAGGHPEIREADHWLEAPASPAWEAASPQRRTLACWFWDAYYGERRNEIVFTGAGLDADRIGGALDSALLTDSELSLGHEGWRTLNDPLLRDAEGH